MSCRNLKKKQWDAFILILAIFNSLVVPLELSFIPDLTNENFFFYTDLIIDVLFLLDVIFMLFTSYNKADGPEVKDQLMIIKNYCLSQRFLFDILSLLGSAVITNYISWLKIMKCFKVVRVFRVNKIIRGLYIHSNLKAILNFIKLFFFLLLYLHILACIWYIALSKTYWIPPVYWLNYHDWLEMDKTL